MSSGQPLQSGNIEYREMVPCQTESLHASEPLQDRRHADETVEGQAEVGQAVQRRELRRQGSQKVPIQEKSLQTRDNNETRGSE